MGIDPSSLTEQQRKRMDPADRKRLGRAGLTAEEASAKYALDTEREVHAKFSTYLHLHGVRFRHDNPAKRSTCHPGWPDFSCFAGEARVLFVEFKVKPNGLTTEQKEIKSYLEGCGFRYLVAYSLVEAIHAVQQHLLC